MIGKTPLVLLPGLLCDAALWEAQVAALSTIAEPWVADLTRDDSMTGMASRVLAMAPPRFALAGLSMGGYVAFEILRRAPERVTRLALLDTWARPDTPELTARRRDFLELADKGEFKGVTSRLLPLLVHPSRLKDQALAGEVMAMAQRVGVAGFRSQQVAIMNRPDSRPLLPTIHVPTLILCGREDMLTPLAMHEEMAEAIPSAHLDVIEHCGHLSPMERSAEVNAAMGRWLAV